MKQLKDYTQVDQYLKENPTLSWEQYCKIQNPSVEITNWIFHKRKRFLKLSRKSIRVRKDSILQILSDHPQGISRDDVIKQLNLKNEKALSNRIYNLRKKNVKITDTKGILKVELKNLPIVHEISKKHKQHTFHIPSSEDKLIEELSCLSKTDRDDFLDLWKRKEYYQACAEALLKVNKGVKKIREKFEILD